MVSKTIFSIIVLVVAAAIVAAFAYWTVPAPRPQNAVPMTTVPANASQNSTVSAVNSSSLNAFNGTAANDTAIQNETLNGSVSQDQNYSVLSTGNIIQSP